MRKENQEKFSKNLWVLYAPDVTAAQGLPAAPSEPWSRSRKQTAARNEQYSSSYSPQLRFFYLFYPEYDKKQLPAHPQRTLTGKILVIIIEVFIKEDTL